MRAKFNFHLNSVENIFSERGPMGFPRCASSAQSQSLLPQRSVTVVTWSGLGHVTDGHVCKQIGVHTRTLSSWRGNSCQSLLFLFKFASFLNDHTSFMGSLWSYYIKWRLWKVGYFAVYTVRRLNVHPLNNWKLCLLSISTVQQLVNLGQTNRQITTFSYNHVSTGPLDVTLP